MSKYSPDFVGQVRKWYLDQDKSDAEIATLAARLTPPVDLTRNAVIGLRQRATPPIIRAGFVQRLLAVHHGQRPARIVADAARDRETKPAPEPTRQRPEPVQTPRPRPVQTPGAPPPYRTKGALAGRVGPILVELEPGQCRNPVGPDATRDRPQMFCGDRVQFLERKGESVADVYCAGCASRNRVGTSTAAALIKSARAYA